MQRILLVSLVICVLGGCGERGGIPRGAIKGTVTLDGAPVERGSIYFTLQPTDGAQSLVTGGAIANGQYRLSAANGPAVGRNRVEIHGLFKTGKKIAKPLGMPGEMVDEYVERTPPRYNSESTLECEVKPGNNRFDADLRP